MHSMISSMGFEEMCPQAVELRSQEVAREKGTETEAEVLRFSTCRVGNTVLTWYH